MKPFRALKDVSRIRLQSSGTQTTRSFATWRTFLFRSCFLKSKRCKAACRS